MKKFLILLVGMFLSINTVFATQIPSEVETYIKESFPQSTVRFDGLVTLPDGTIYLPLFPSMSPKGQEFGIKLWRDVIEFVNKHRCFDIEIKGQTTEPFTDVDAEYCDGGFIRL